MKHSFKILIASFFLLSNCDKKEDTSPVFPIKYEVIINDDDYELSKVLFYAHTYFPKENETIIHGFGKYRSVDFRKDNYLKMFDTLRSSPFLDGYKGCQIYLEVIFHYEDNVAKIKETYVLQDTLEINNGLIRFEWPADTAHF